MADIYRNSFLTIAAATKAQSCSEGIFSSPTRQEPLFIDLVNGYARLWLDTAPFNWDNCVEEDALNQRGWTEWAEARSTTREIEPPSTSNKWIGSCDLFNRS